MLVESDLLPSEQTFGSGRHMPVLVRARDAAGSPAGGSRHRWCACEGPCTMLAGQARRRALCRACVAGPAVPTTVPLSLQWHGRARPFTRRLRLTSSSLVPRRGWMPKCSMDADSTWPARCAGMTSRRHCTQAPAATRARAAIIRRVQRDGRARQACRPRHQRAWSTPSAALTDWKATAVGCTCACWSARWSSCGSIWKRLDSVHGRTLSCRAHAWTWGRSARGRRAARKRTASDGQKGPKCP